MPIANVNGVNLNYEIVGQGKPVVFLHGYIGSSQDWARQVPVLSPRYKVVVLDQRGRGRSAVPSREEEYSVRIFADDVFALLRMLNIKKCCLVGHSLGGFTALQFALEHQDMLVALVLVDTSSGEFVRPPDYARLRQKLDELARSQGMEAAFEYDAANNPQRIERFQKNPEIRELIRRKMLRLPVDGYIYIPKAIEKWEPVTSRLSEIKVPTLIYRGDEDTPFLMATQILKDGIADAELVTIKGAGHFPHEESPEFFNDKLLEFLSRVNW